MDATVTLTSEQRSALSQGQPVHVVESETQTDCILIRADVFARVKSLVLNDHPLTDEQKLAAIRFAGETGRLGRSGT